MVPVLLKDGPVAEIWQSSEPAILAARLKCQLKQLAPCGDRFPNNQPRTGPFGSE